MKRQFIYLASPYSHPDASVREARYQANLKKTAEYLSEGKPVFSPIAHTHHVADFLEERLRMDHEFWMKADLAILRDAAELHVLMLDGWQQSKGVAREIEYADSIGIPVFRVQA
jgi:hypothetical protein